MDNFRVLKAKEEDWEEAMGLAFRTFRKYVEPDYPKEGADNFIDFISDPHLFNMFRIGEYHLWVARDDEEDEIIGMGSIRSGNHISLLFVDEKWHKKGVGKQIMKKMEDFVREGGRDKITVNASPYGIPFYHRIGFEDTSGQILSGGMYMTPMEKRV